MQSSTLRTTFRSLAFRLVASAALWSTIGLAIGGLLLANVFRDTVVRNFDQSLIALWETLVANIELDDTGRLTKQPDISDPRFYPSFSGWYWQVHERAPRRATPVQSAEGAGTGNTGQAAPVHAQSRSMWDFALPVPDSLSPMDYTRAYVAGPDNQNLRVIARMVKLPGSANPFAIVIAANKNQIDQEIARFNAILAWAFAALGAGLLLAILVQVRVGLSPLRLVKEELQRIRNGRSERLHGPFPSEIAPLADELNALIDHNTQVLDRARTQVGNLAHALKTPLSVLSAEASARNGPQAVTVAKQTHIMKEQIDHYLSRARAAATAKVIGARTPVLPVLESLKRTLNKLYAARELTITIECPQDLAFRGDEQDFQEIAGNLLDNGCKWAHKTVKIKVDPVQTAGAQQLTLTVEDDGPGLTPDLPETYDEIVKRGTRLDETIPGSGLGLSIVAELTENYRGALHLERSALGGLKVNVALPAVD